MKEFDYSSVRVYKLFKIIWPMIKLLSLILFRIRYAGRENLPKTGPYIIASNHITSKDPAFIMMSRMHNVHFMAKTELFDNPFTGFLYKHCNAFPVARGLSNKTAVLYAVRLLKEGHIVGIFPEGTRSADLTPQEPKTGAALIARETCVPVVPACVYASEEVKLFSKITVRFGKPIAFEDLGFGETKKASELRTASALIMKEITELWEEGHC